MQNEKMILNNGIEIILCQNDTLNSITIGFYFKSGIIYETLKNNGISHLVEHLFFRNLNGMKQKELYFRMESIGTTMRAKTYLDFVCFDMTISQKYFNEALKIMIELLSYFEWSEEIIKKELAVVKKQIEFKATDSFSDFVNNKYLQGTKLNKPIIGTVNSVCNLSNKEINDWKQVFFNCNNVCCVLTGGFSKIESDIFLQNLNSIKSSPVTAPKERIILPRNFCKRTTSSDLVIETEWEISDISVTFDIPDEININYVNVISSILGEGVGSKLSLLLREEMALTDEIYSKIDTFSNICRLTIEFSVYNKDVVKSLELMFSEIRKFKLDITQKDLSSVIVFFTENQKFIFDSPRECNFFLGWNDFILHNEININNNIKQYSKITCEELITVANKIFKSENLIITVTNNNKFCDINKLKNTISTIRGQLA